MTTKDFLSISDLTADDLVALVDRSAAIKADPGIVRDGLADTPVALLFEKPSTRTRTSFEVAVGQMGGQPVVLTTVDMQLGRGETVQDTGRVLSRYVDAIVIRTFEQSRLDVLAEAADVPVINALSDLEHPCQAVGDLLTLKEHKGDYEGLTVTYLGDGNNTAHALMLAGTKLGMHLRVASPAGFEPDEDVLRRCEEAAAVSGGSVMITNDPDVGTKGTDVLYTDVWASMGREGEADARKQVFPPYALDARAIASAAPDVIVMHCLPAHRGLEISDEAMDGPHAVVWDQAENRLHTQKAILLRSLGR